MKSLRNRKAFAIMQLKKAANPVEPEEKLIFASLAQAIEDIGDPDPKKNSEKDWKDGYLIIICDTLDLNYEYVCQIMNEQKLF